MNWRTTVSPSPRELRDQLSSEELVAMDLILSGKGGEDNAQMTELIADPIRRGYLRTLGVQLAALGDTLHDSETLDHARAAWEEARQRYTAEQAARDRERAEIRERAQLWLEALSPEVRRVVERRRRRQQRREQR